MFFCGGSRTYYNPRRRAYILSEKEKSSCGVVPFSDWPSNDSDALMLIRKAPIFSLLIILLRVPGDVLHNDVGAILFDPTLS